jgi:HNH endonuclease
MNIRSNVKAAHIIGVEAGLKKERPAAGVLNAYDTMNGLLLEASLHEAFDSYL